MSDKTIYYCDPTRNTQCRKTGCFLRGGPCQSVSDIEFAMLNDRGLPVVSDGNSYQEENQNESKLEGSV